MRLLEWAAFLAVFVTMGKFFERELGLWPAIGLTLVVVFGSVGLYALMNRGRA